MESIVRYLTEEEQRVLLSKVKSQSSLLARRDAAWIELLIATGMRVQEFAAMTRADAWAALKTGYIYIPKAHRKGGKRDHSVFVTVTVRDCLQRLLAIGAEMGADDSQAMPLVVSRKHVAMTVRAFEYAMRRWADRAGLVQRVTPHWLRHTRAMNIMRRSTSSSPIRVVQAALGHASLASTGVYTKLSREEIERDLEAVDGRRPRVRIGHLRAEYERREGAA